MSRDGLKLPAYSAPALFHSCHDYALVDLVMYRHVHFKKSRAFENVIVDIRFELGFVTRETSKLALKRHGRIIKFDSCPDMGSRIDLYMYR